ncbi:hypothetical protein AADQ46_005388, partial [Enterobacter soli]
MINIDKQWLQQKIADMESTRDEIPFGLDEDDSNTLAALRIALASLEAEPVAWDYERASCITCEGPQGFKRVIEHEYPPEWAIKEGRARNIVPLYADPPAPASVPDAYIRDGRGRMMLNGRQEPRIGYSAGWNACRAAMLQGAEPVTTAGKLPFEQWLSQQTGTIDVECGCVMTEVFFHWLRVAYEAGNSPVIPDGWKLVPVEPTAEMLQSGISAHYERNQIQIHDRSAPGPMECAYVAMLAAAPHQGADGNSPVIPDGWVAVPVEPTIAILDEFDSIIDYGAEDSKDAWSRLLAAAWIKSLPA